MEYLKKYKYIIIILFLSLGLVFTEFYIFKGYFSSQSVLRPYSNQLIPISPNDPDSLLFYDYSVKYKDDTTLVFNLRHNGLGCQYITHYRDNELFPNLQETVEYFPNLYRIKSPYKNMEIPQIF